MINSLQTPVRAPRPSFPLKGLSITGSPNQLKLNSVKPCRSSHLEGTVATAPVLEIRVPVAPLFRGDAGPPFHNQLWRHDSLGVSNPLEQGIPVIITWNYGGSDVLVEGSWDNWASRKLLQRAGKDHSILLVLPSGIYHYKFIVDGQSRYTPDLPFVSDEAGNVCNLLDVHLMVEGVGGDVYSGLFSEESGLATIEELKGEDEVVEGIEEDVNRSFGPENGALVTFEVLEGEKEGVEDVEGDEKSSLCPKDSALASNQRVVILDAKRLVVGAGARALFYPTLLYNVVRNKFEPEFRWWDRVDEFILLGAVPFPSDVPTLKELGVQGVVTLNEPYETLVPTSLYKGNLASSSHSSHRPAVSPNQATI